jgi:hypothetical protein
MPEAAVWRARFLQQTTRTAPSSASIDRQNFGVQYRVLRFVLRRNSPCLFEGLTPSRVVDSRLGRHKARSTHL